MQKFSLHYHSFVLITPLYHSVRRGWPLGWARLAITSVTRAQQLTQQHSGFNEQTSGWAPTGPRLQILVSGYRSSLPKMWRGPDWALERMTFSANKWPVRLFPGSSIIQLLWGETEPARNTIQPGSLLVSTTIIPAHIQRIFNQAPQSNES